MRVSRLIKGGVLRLAQAGYTVVARLAPKAAQGQKEPARVLLLNGSHLGDVILSMWHVAAIRAAWPGAEIGFVAGSWSAAVLRNHPQVEHLHIIDHWYLSRASDSLAGKVERYRATCRTALAEIRSLRYDVAVCLHPWTPSFLHLAWTAGIPVRVAFSRTLAAPLATVVAEYPDDSTDPFVQHAMCQSRLLTALGIDAAIVNNSRPTLAPSTSPAVEELRSLLGEQALPYSIVHLGSGNPAKELPTELWVTVVNGLAESGKVVFTGHGTREDAAIEAVRSRLAPGGQSVNVCGKLSWDGFVAAVRSAQVLYGVDSAAVHVAAAVGTRSVAVYSGIGGVGRWRPISDLTTVWSNPVPCSPCHLPHGCAQMSCMVPVSADDLLNSRWSEPSLSPKAVSASTSHLGPERADSSSKLAIKQLFTAAEPK